MRTSAVVWMVAALLAAGTAQAQYGSRKPKLQAFAVGARLGGEAGNIRLDDAAYDIYSSHSRVGASAGLWMQWRTAGGAALRPEVMWALRGGGLDCHDVAYSVQAQYVSFRLGAAYHLPIERQLTSVYAVAAPEVAMLVGGRVNYSDAHIGEVGMAINASDHRPVEAGIYLGMGLDCPLSVDRRLLYLQVEAGYRIGLTSTFAERQGSTVLNPTLTPQGVFGRRTTGGFELAVRLGIPFGEEFKIRR